MFGRKRQEERVAADAAASLAPAFSQLDLFGEKLDALRRQYNETAKELAAIPPPSELSIPTPMLNFTPQLSPLSPLAPPLQPSRPEKFAGRYSVNNPPDPRSLRPPPVPPRPTPRKTEPKPEPRRTPRSGRYYIQVANAKDLAALQQVRDQVSKCGRVVDSGRGTASDAEAGWMEVAVRAEDTGAFIAKLEGLEVKDRVEKLIEVQPGEGRLQARQLDLFRLKQDVGH